MLGSQLPVKISVCGGAREGNVLTVLWFWGLLAERDRPATVGLLSPFLDFFPPETGWL